MEETIQCAQKIIEQKINAYHAQIYDIEDEDELDLIYFYIREETNGKKKKMEKIIQSTKYIAFVRMEKYVYFKNMKRRYVYTIEEMVYDKDHNLTDIILNKKPLLLTNFNEYE